MTGSVTHADGAAPVMNHQIYRLREVQTFDELFEIVNMLAQCIVKRVEPGLVRQATTNVVGRHAAEFATEGLDHVAV